MKKILFICTGNTCRSPMAEGILNKMLEERGIKNIKVRSAGVSAAYGAALGEHALKAMSEIGVDIKGHKSKKVTRDVLSDADIVIAMSKLHISVLSANFPEFKDKMTQLKEGKDITDPFAGTLNTYRECRDEISEALERAFEKGWFNEI